MKNEPMSRTAFSTPLDRFSSSRRTPFAFFLFLDRDLSGAIVIRGNFINYLITYANRRGKSIRNDIDDLPETDRKRNQLVLRK